MKFQKEIIFRQFLLHFAPYRIIIRNLCLLRNNKPNRTHCGVKLVYKYEPARKRTLLNKPSAIS